MSRNRHRDGSWVQRRVQTARGYLSKDIWSVELTRLPTLRAIFYKAVRVIYLAVIGFRRDNCLFRASGLTYYTVLSLVPLLAFSFSVAKGLGAYERLRQDTIEPFLDETIGPAPEIPADAVPGDLVPKGTHELRRAVDRVLEFVERTNLSSLGMVGLLILVYTVVKLLSTIEQSFNEIWGVIRARSIARRFSDYLSVIVVVPLFLGAATSLGAAAQSSSVVEFLSERLRMGPLIDLYLRLSSLFAMWIGFTLFYLFMPNTRTPLRSCLIGGILGGSMWQAVQILHVELQIGMANYNALYSSFAAFPILMIWIYLSWVTVLLGAELAFAHHNEPAYRQIAISRRYDQSFKEVLALRVLARVASAFVRSAEAHTVWSLAQGLGVSEHTLREIVLKLREKRILAATDVESDTRLLPARDLESIRLKDVFDALKGSECVPDFPAQDDLDRALDEVYAAWEDDARASSHNLTLHDLAEMASPSIEPAPDPSTEPTRGPRRLGRGPTSETRRTKE